MIDFVALKDIPVYTSTKQNFFAVIRGAVKKNK